MIKIYNYGQVSDDEIFSRDNIAPDIQGVVGKIISDVIKRGDEALRDYTLRFDGACLDCLEVSPEEFKAGCALVTPEFKQVLNKATENIRRFHEKQVRTGFIADGDGTVMGQRIIPIEKVGIYVPGGTAAYPSTVLMNCIPAKTAGCSEIIIATPPGEDGKVPPAILAAAKIAGADRVFKVGGAQAIAALAYGTESIPKVDKITGPGNAYVAEAKKQVFGQVSIDMIAGPSEILIVADSTCPPEYAAADLLSQAEHDRMASAVLVTDSRSLAQSVSAEIERMIPQLPRADIARASIDNNGKIIVAEGNLALAFDIANRIAPEHLEICTDSPFDHLGKIKNAGSVFMGKYCPEALGDYFAGPNHTLPTSGTARFSSPLSVDDFVKKMQYTYFTRDALKNVADDVALFAREEGLDAHAESALIRFGKGTDKDK